STSNAAGSGIGSPAAAAAATIAAERLNAETNASGPSARITPRLPDRRSGLTTQGKGTGVGGSPGASAGPGSPGGGGGRPGTPPRHLGLAGGGAGGFGRVPRQAELSAGLRGDDCTAVVHRQHGAQRMYGREVGDLPGGRVGVREIQGQEVAGRRREAGIDVE